MYGNTRHNPLNKLRNKNINEHNDNTFDSKVKNCREIFAYATFKIYAEYDTSGIIFP